MIHVERTISSDTQTADKIERAIRGCIGERPNENWNVSIALSGRFCTITIRGPVQTRREVFYDEWAELPEKIAAWLRSYPLR